ncbi:mapk-regulated corepressor-interacting protein 1 isoform X2 [Aotus nancymaae]|uniref:mapk-regulated corepressor-interacting protein 1 isoform X2 n=1 Tax=Aotus nancymaae TaxID=37293 RepID=UPI00062577F8|nr:mapk-regulated corepressor-interacting protein 1 isoform X2 [Aotus nancymaae]
MEGSFLPSLPPSRPWLLFCLRLGPPQAPPVPRVPGPICAPSGPAPCSVLSLPQVLWCPPPAADFLTGIGQRLRGSGGGALGSDAPAMTSSPVSRVVYNGKRTSSPRSPPSSSEIFTPAHEENVRFIYEAWQGVERDLRSQVPGGERGLVEEYVEKVPNPSLKTFKPIDLSDLKRRSTQDAKKS